MTALPKSPRWHDYLPAFETLARCKLHRAQVLKALTCDDGTSALPAKCTKAKRCKSGFCPVCIRLLRMKLLPFDECERLHRYDWVYANIRFECRDIEPGDCSTFGKLRDHKLVKRVINGRRFWRLDEIVAL
jgi:hypothetical protein